MADDDQRRRVPSPYEARSRQFGEALNRLMADRVRQGLEHMIAPENNLQLHHGGSWEYHRADGSDHEGVLQEVSAKHELPFAEIASNDMSTLTNFIHSLTEGMVGELSRGIYQTVSLGAASVGNTVSVREAGSTAKAFLEMLKRIDFGVNPDGTISRPAVHAAPDVADKMLAELNAQGPEFQQEIERITEQKISKALADEQARRDRYKKRRER